jgi:DNA-binding MarR family transcriptional regulator
MEPHYTFDPAAAIDDEADLLAEELGCSRGLALRILARDKQREEHRLISATMDEKEIIRRTLRRVLFELVLPGNTQVRVWSLMFASGLVHICKCPPRSQAEKAEELGVTRATMSHFVRRAKRIWAFEDTTYSRTESAVRNSRDARLRVVHRNGNGHTNGSH